MRSPRRKTAASNIGLNQRTSGHILKRRNARNERLTRDWAVTFPAWINEPAGA
jgi:hypothetical protein